MWHATSAWVSLRKQMPQPFSGMVLHYVSTECQDLHAVATFKVINKTAKDDEYLSDYDMYYFDQLAEHAGLQPMFVSLVATQSTRFAWLCALVTESKPPRDSSVLSSMPFPSVLVVDSSECRYCL